MKWLTHITKEMVQYFIAVFTAIIEPIIDLIEYIKSQKNKKEV